MDSIFVLKSLILEQTRVEYLVNKLTKSEDGRKPLLGAGTLAKLIAADPKTKVSAPISEIPKEDDINKIQKVGPYAQWLIKQYLTNIKPNKDNYAEQHRFFEDLYKTTIDLEKFDRFKERLPIEKRDINKLTFFTLFTLVKDFDLHKNVTKKEKDVIKTTFDHPGAKIEFKNDSWTVVKISDSGKAGKEAACFFGGYNEESRWCTSAPGLNYFDKYIKDGPLYVILSNNDETRGKKTGLPNERYQFHFQSNQFMDVDDNEIDLIDFLNKRPELKNFFKGVFKENIQSDKSNIDEVVIESGGIGIMYIFLRLYGIESLIDTLNKDISSLTIKGEGDSFNLPDNIGLFSKLQMLILTNCIKHIPDSIANCKELLFVSLINNPKLTELPSELFNLKKLVSFVLTDTPNIRVPSTYKDIGNKIYIIER